MHGEADAEVRVVVEVRAGGDDPVDEAGFDERDQRGDSESRGRQRAGERQPDRDLRLQHLLGEELAGFAQPRGVVSEKRFVD